MFTYYWIFETFTTVGYGDYAGSSSYEFLFSLLLEFAGLIINSVLLFIMSTFFEAEIGFQSLVRNRMSELDVWIMKLEKSNKPQHMNPQLYRDITDTVENAFYYDYNLIVEEYDLY